MAAAILAIVAGILAGIAASEEYSVIVTSGLVGGAVVLGLYAVRCMLDDALAHHRQRLNR